MPGGVNHGRDVNQADTGCTSVRQLQPSRRLGAAPLPPALAGMCCISRRACAGGAVYYFILDIGQLPESGDFTVLCALAWCWGTVSSKHKLFRGPVPGQT